MPLLFGRAITALALAVAAALVMSSPTDAHRLRSFRGHMSHVHFGPDAPTDVKAPVAEKYFDRAILDHFAPLSERKYWKQRYFVNEEFWAGRDYPVFVSIGGEGPVGSRALTNRTFIYAMAKKHRALLIAVEHRYYGKSYPTVDMSLPNLRFLSSAQALADLARMHAFITDTYGLSDSKTQWIGFGGSYPGNLAAWVKLKYPALFAGTIASSAPLRAKTDFFEYMEVVGDGLRYFGGGECYHAVEHAITELRKLMDGGAAGRKRIDELFTPCDHMTNEYDDSVFEGAVMSAFQGVAQYNALSPDTVTLAETCALFMNATNTTPLERLATFLVATREPNATCLDSKFEGSANATVDVLRNATFDGTSSARQWFFQTCNEFGYFQTAATSTHSPFHALRSLTERNVGAEICKRVFNIEIEPDVESTNLEYGGLGITVENVTFPSGSIDPWHALAVQNSTTLHSQTASAVYIEGTAHCADMYYPSEHDAPALQWAHAKIAAAIDRYLGKSVETVVSGSAITELAVDRQHDWMDVTFDGSHSKLFTAVAMHQLQEQGLVNLSRSVSAYLTQADFARFGIANQTTWCPHVQRLDKFADGATPCETVTFEQLLTMGSGLHDATMPTTSYHGSIAKHVGEFINAPLAFEPGTDFKYAHANYVLLSYFIEQLSGQTLDTYLMDHIFAPIGLTSTFYDPHSGTRAVHRGVVSQYANFYVQTSSPQNELNDRTFVSTGACSAYPASGALSGAGGVHSTAKDMHRVYKDLFLHRGERSAVLSAASIRALVQTRNPVQRAYAQGVYVAFESDYSESESDTEWPTKISNCGRMECVATCMAMQTLGADSVISSAFTNHIEYTFASYDALAKWQPSDAPRDATWDSINSASRNTSDSSSNSSGDVEIGDYQVAELSWALLDVFLRYFQET